MTTRHLAELKEKLVQVRRLSRFIAHSHTSTFALIIVSKEQEARSEADSLLERSRSEALALRVTKEKETEFLVNELAQVGDSFFRYLTKLVIQISPFIGEAEQGHICPR